MYIIIILLNELCSLVAQVSLLWGECSAECPADFLTPASITAGQEACTLMSVNTEQKTSVQKHPHKQSASSASQETDNSTVSQPKAESQYSALLPRQDLFYYFWLLSFLNRVDSHASPASQALDYWNKVYP